MNCIQVNKVYLKFLIVLLFMLSSTSFASNRYALLVGNEVYSDDKLNNPVKDVTDLAVALRRLNFKVSLGHNLNKSTFLEAVETLRSKLKQGDTVLFYYAGHGVQVNNENYFIPIRSNINSSAEVVDEAISASYVLKRLSKHRDNFKILFLDACRNNPFKEKLRNFGFKRGLARMPPSDGTVIAYATEAGRWAADGEVGKNGVFTKHILKNISTANIDVEELLRRIRIGVAEETKGKQTPWTWTEVPSIRKFCFAGCLDENIDPTPVKPIPVKPIPVKPIPVKPVPVKPVPVKPVPVKPVPVKPVPVKPKCVTGYGADGAQDSFKSIIEKMSPGKLKGLDNCYAK